MHLLAALLLPSWTPAVLPTPTHCARCALRLCDAGSWLEPEDEDIVEDAQLFKKQKGTYKAHVVKDDRDKLLYDITESTPPPTMLGQFRLGPSAGCGDLISARVRLDGEAAKSEQTFVIKSVSYRYAYQRGAYRMIGKGASVKRADREMTERFLKRMLPKEDSAAASSSSSSSGGDSVGDDSSSRGVDEVSDA